MDRVTFSYLFSTASIYTGPVNWWDSHALQDVLMKGPKKGKVYSTIGEKKQAIGETSANVQAQLCGSFSATQERL